MLYSTFPWFRPYNKCLDYNKIKDLGMTACDLADANKHINPEGVLAVIDFELLWAYGDELKFELMKAYSQAGGRDFEQLWSKFATSGQYKDLGPMVRNITISDLIASYRRLGTRPRGFRLRTDELEMLNFLQAKNRWSKFGNSDIQQSYKQMDHATGVMQDICVYYFPLGGGDLFSLEEILPVIPELVH